MKILFSEEEWYYRDLGLEDIEGVSYVFGGMRFYKSPLAELSQYYAFICAYYTMPHNVMLTIKFNSLGVRTILCSDGIFDFSNAFLNIMHRKYGLVQFQPILQNYFICVGKNEANYFCNGVKAMEYMPKRMISSERPSLLPREQRVLVTTANTSYFNDDEYERLFQLISDVLVLLVDKNVKFSVRFFDDRLLTDLNIMFKGILQNDVDQGFEETLERYSAVVTTPSSIAVVSMFHKRPTALLVYRDFPMFLQTGWMVPSASVFSSLLKDFLLPDQDRMKIQNSLYENYATENNLTDRISEVLGKDNTNFSEYRSYINKSYENMLESKFNINVEWYVRRLYRFFRKYKFISSFLNRLKRSIF
jgi:hypothetical protein